LVEEIIREAGVERFHMYSSEQFLQFADTHLNVRVSKDSIAQVTESKEQARRLFGRAVEIRHLGILAERAVQKWLINKYPDNTVEKNSHSFPDFVVDLEAAGKLGIEVAVLRGQFGIMPDRLERIFRGHYEVASGNLQRCLFIFVLADEVDEKRLIRSLRSRLNEIPPGVDIQFGRLRGSDDDPVFEPQELFTI
jgi:hypothetical protein